MPTVLYVINAEYRGEKVSYTSSISLISCDLIINIAPYIVLTKAYTYTHTHTHTRARARTYTV